MSKIKRTVGRPRGVRYPIPAKTYVDANLDRRLTDLAMAMDKSKAKTIRELICRGLAIEDAQAKAASKPR